MANLDCVQDPSDRERLWIESEELVRSCRKPSAALGEDEVIGSICRAARRLTEADGACVILREGELVHYSHEDTVAPLWAGQRFPIENCISGWSILHREPAIIEDIYTDERIPVEYYRNTFVKSLAMQPIQPENPIGSLGAYWSGRHRATPRELALLEKLADVAALVLQNLALRRALCAVRDEAASADRRKDDLLATVSHELRSPLNAILGWAALLRLQRSDESVVDRALQVIEDNATAQARLLEDLLEVSRVAAPRLRLECAPVDVDRLVRAALDAVHLAARRRGIRIDTEIAAAGTISGDGPRLGQVLRNLLDNAVKFTPEQGRIRVAVERKDSRVRIAVSDDGIGIGPDLLPFVFDRYRQGRAAAGTPPASGLGLGLEIARRIVELHGGSIEARSDGNGRGATFAVELPVAGGKRP